MSSMESAAEPVRLAKRLAEVTGCSRAEAERYIEGGWVLVDGAVVEEPQHRVTSEKVELRQGAKADPVAPVTLLLHKPAGVASGLQTLLPLLAPDARAGDDASRIRPLRKHFVKLEVCAPLEAPASGLVVLTQDWRVARKFVEDGATLEHEMVADVSGTPLEDALGRIGRGLQVGGRALPPIKASWQSERRLRLPIKGLHPGQVEWMCSQVGLELVALRRLRIGRVPMAGLAAGQWRYLPPNLRF